MLHMIPWGFHPISELVLKFVFAGDEIVWLGDIIWSPHHVRQSRSDVHASSVTASDADVVDAPRFNTASA